MKIVLRLFILLAFALSATLYWGQEGFAHLLFPSVPDDVALNPNKLVQGLDFEQSLILLVATIFISLLLFLYFKKAILPKISATLLNWLTGQDSCYTPEDDELVQIMEQLGSTPSREDLRLLDDYCQRKPKRLRNWTEYANLLRSHFHDAEAAIEVLKRALSVTKNTEDQALLLYRIAAIYEGELNRPDEAKQFYTQAASQHPLCSYGKLAARKIG